MATMSNSVSDGWQVGQFRERSPTIAVETGPIDENRCVLMFLKRIFMYGVVSNTCVASAINGTDG